MDPWNETHAEFAKGTWVHRPGKGIEGAGYSSRGATTYHKVSSSYVSRASRIMGYWMMCGRSMAISTSTGGTLTALAGYAAESQQCQRCREAPA